MKVAKSALHEASLRFPRSRELRRVFRDRLAKAALVVILAYVLLAALLACGGASSLKASVERVGPDSTPGFGEQSVEKRLEDAAFQLKRVGSALTSRNVDAALADLALFELRIALEPADELRAIAARGRDLHDELRASIDGAGNDASRAIEAELRDAGFEDRTQIRIRSSRAARTAVEALHVDPAFLGRLDELESTVAELFAPLAGADRFWYGLRRSLGTDTTGRSIAMRAIYSIVPALSIGVVTAFVSVLLGSLLGAAAAFYGGVVDHVVVWLCTTLSSIPTLVMLIVLAYAFRGGPWEHGLLPVYAAFATTFWIGPCRVVRGEVAKLKELEYVQAAIAVGFGRARVLVRHVVPNLAHLMLVHFSLAFVAAVKAEVILSYLGLGVKVGPSWGTMINDSTAQVLSGSFWQIGAATGFMLVLVLAFTVLSDALQDAFDPKHAA